MKELGQLKYFKVIGVAKSEKDIMLSQHKYVIDLLNKPACLVENQQVHLLNLIISCAVLVENK